MVQTRHGHKGREILLKEEPRGESFKRNFAPTEKLAITGKVGALAI
jgi:hypothetical protein